MSHDPKAGTTNNAGSIAGVNGGIQSGNRWGLKGSEDLGDGLRAVFQLESGFDLSTDDVIRREVIMIIMCSMPLHFEEFEARHGVSFAARFSDEIERLQPYIEAGLLEIDAWALRVMPKGSFVPVPLLCALHFGEMLCLGDDELRSSFLNRSRDALIALAPPAA